MAGYGPMARMRDMGLVECELDISPCRLGAVVARNELNKMGKQKSLADKFEYVMHGLLYKISENTEGPDVKVVVYISFGGLQLMLKGNPAKMGKFKVDERNIVHSLKLVESQLDPHLSQLAAVPV
ncbi:unnamed protein product [Ilex paraguariensis]|uniref:Uncharacterized protein n=1 Tax=Ilex paraguariensis TaxID=185542 RepID=A0ABC8UNJ4_9AQUA